MNLDICIASYRRPAKLERCLKSIISQTHSDWTVNVLLDNKDFDTYRGLQSYWNHSRIGAKVNGEHLYVRGSWNKFLREFDGNIAMMLVDDVELEHDCLEKAVKAMEEHFTDLDGVVGITQNGKQNGFVPAGQCLIGRRFVGRFKEVGYQVYCPDFTHWWVDHELWRYADSLNKFYLCPEAKLIHFHPSFYKEEMDETHKIVRGEIKQMDLQTHNERVKRGLVWGDSFELVGGQK